MFTILCKKIIISSVFFSAEFKSDTIRHYARSRGLDREKAVAVAVANAGWQSMIYVHFVVSVNTPL
jgi:hypothetical protein